MVQFSKGVGFGMTRNLNQTSQSIQQALSQLSSGKRINSFSDDASGGVIATKLESAYRGINEQIQGAQQDLSIAQVQDAGLYEVGEDLQRIRALQVQAQNTTDPDSGAAIQTEIDQLTQGIQQTLDTTTFGTQQVLEAGGELAGLLEGGIDATGDLAATDAAIDEVSAQRADVGARMNAAQGQVDQLNVAFENLAASQSQIVDTDFAAETARLAKEQIIMQSNVGSILALNQSAQSVLRLLGG